jgi:WD40 repeat protein
MLRNRLFFYLFMLMLGLMLAGKGASRAQTNPQRNFNFPLNDVAARPQGGAIAVATYSNVLLLSEDLITTQATLTLPDAVLADEPEYTDIHSVNWSTDGRYLVAGLSDGFVRVWNYQTLAVVVDLTTDTSYCIEAAFSFDNSKLAALCQTNDDFAAFGQIYIWDTTTWQRYAQPQLPLRYHYYFGYYGELAWSRDGQRVAVNGLTSSKDGVAIYNLETGAYTAIDVGEVVHSLLWDSKGILLIEWGVFTEAYDPLVNAVTQDYSPVGHDAQWHRNDRWVIGYYRDRFLVTDLPSDTKLLRREMGYDLIALAWMPDYSKILVAGNNEQNGLLEVVDVSQLQIPSNSPTLTPITDIVTIVPPSIYFTETPTPQK